jgi:hypothetical protein
MAIKGNIGLEILRGLREIKGKVYGRVVNIPAHRKVVNSASEGKRTN